MRLTLALVALTLALPALASEPGQPLDCSDWVFHEAGVVCATIAACPPPPPPPASPITGCHEFGSQAAFDNQGRLIRVRKTFRENCGPAALPMYTTELGWYDRGAWYPLATLDDRCTDSMTSKADFVHVFGGLEFDDKGGVLAVSMTTRSCALDNCAGWIETNELQALAGFATAFEILQSYESQPAAFSFRVPYMPEGFPAADSFDAYYGELANPIDFTTAQPLQCEFPRKPMLGDYLTVDNLPTPPVGQGYYFVTAVNYMGQRRYGRQRLEGELSGRDPGLLPACNLDR